MKKNEVVELTIEDMSSEGLGIGHAGGMAVFVKDTVPGDRVRAKVVKEKKTYVYARLEGILTPGPDRVPPLCPAARRCGGCQIQELSYPAQLRLKERKVRENLIRIGGLNPAEGVIRPVIGMENPWHYRNKAQFPVGVGKEGEIVAGFYAGRTHSIIDCHQCMIGIDENQYILETVLSWMNEYGVQPYNEKDGTGIVRHVMTRAGFSTGDLMVVLVAAASKLKEEEALVRMLLGAVNERPEQQERSVEADLAAKAPAKAGSAVDADRAAKILVQAGSVVEADQAAKTPVQAGSAVEADQAAKAPVQAGSAGKARRFRVTGIILNTNRARTNVILGRENRVLYGKDYIEDRIGPLTYRVSAGSFYQVNPVQTAILYRTALEYAALTGREIVWDLYCGTGTISLFLAQQAGKVIGVEVIPEAVKNAQQNAALNHIDNCEFIAGKAEELAGSLPPADVIVVDPPRKGLDRIVIDTILLAAPDRIVYVSCDSATLARDLALFTQGGYRLQKVQPVDQFGHSVHVETICLLGRKNDGDVEYISIPYKPPAELLTPENLNPGKGSYTKIKKWIHKRYGCKVSSLYIAQIKRKYGIIEHEDYNQTKDRQDSPPRCPAEKEKMIVEALKHFKMI